MLGAANVNSGALAKFISSREPIRVEHILASCAVPNIFPAVQIGEDAYWDGLFSDNPPVEELIRPRSVGAENIPDEIWLIKINPTAQPARAGEAGRDHRPAQPDRGQHLAVPAARPSRDAERHDPRRTRSGPEFLARFDIKAPVRIPKSFHSDADKPYHIPCIEMPVELQNLLDYEGKIDRGTTTSTV